ncbi:MAG: amidohydrolase family protein [Thermoplasmata archaeon]
MALPHPSEEYWRKVEGMDFRFAGALVIAPPADLPRTRALNDKVLALAKESAGRFFSMCSVHPADGAEALSEVDRVATAGARGLKLHPNTQKFDVADPAITAVVQRAAERKLPVLFDAYSPFDADQAGKFVLLAMQVPEARIILAHAHGNRFSDLLVYEILARYPWWKRNVWVDLSATASLLAGGPFAEQFAWVCRKVGTDRLLFGSDYPLDEPRTAVEAVVSLGFTESELGAIFYGNAAGLFGLPPP